MPLAAGNRLGHYEIVAPIGAGGMGEVYRSRDTRLGREVAIKVLPEHLARDPAAQARFEREARAIAALSHPNILAIHDFGAEQGVSYAVTELLEGETLRDRLSAGPLGWRKAVEIGAAVADGLSAAHAKEITHRDLKPANIFLTSDGRVKILDFGLARWKPPSSPEGETEAETEVGTVLGTVGYMSPEQVRGAAVDARSDIFSLGCVLYEIVAGKRAFVRASGPESMAAILNEDPAPLAQTGREIPPDLERVVGHCLEKNSQQRFQSAADVAFNLRAVGGSKTGVGGRGLGVGAKLGAAAALLAIVAAVAWYFIGRSGQAIDSLAVLPLVNAGADPNAEYLSDGITESLINSLSQLPNLAVKSQSLVRRYRGREVDVRAVGRELGVKAVLSGRVVQRGDGLAISVELVEVATANQIWGQQFNRKLADLMTVQEEISRAITDKLRLRLSGADTRVLAKRSTGNTEAYQLYLKGRYYWSKRTPEGFQAAIDYFQQAIAKDPGYARAYAGLADGYSLMGGYNVLPPKEAFPKARAAATKALEIDDSLAEAHGALGVIKVIYEWDWPGAERELRRALELDPNDANLRYYQAGYHASLGRLEEGLREMRKAVEIDPLSLVHNSILGWFLHTAGRHDEAIAQLRKTLEMDPNFPFATWSLGVCYLEKGRYEDAREAFQKGPPGFGGGPEPTPMLARVHAAAGRTAEARNVLDELQRKAPEKMRPPFAVAGAYALLGQKDQAFAWLERGYQERALVPYLFLYDPALESVRSDPRYANLLRRMGLQP